MGARSRLRSLDVAAQMALVRTNAISSVATTSLAQSTWYIRAQTGNDNADGHTSSSALKTKRQLLQRLNTSSPCFVIPTYVVIYILEDEPDASDTIDFSPFLASVNNTALFLFGTLTPIYSGTLSGVSVLSRSTSLPSGLTIANIGAGASVPGGAQGLLLQDNVTGGTCWVDSVSGGVAICTAPYAGNAPTPPTQPKAFTLAQSSLGNGHSFTLYRPVKTHFGRISAKCQGQATDQSSLSSMFFAVNLYFADPSGTPGFSMQYTNDGTRYAQCRFDSAVVTDRVDSPFSGGPFVNCWLPSGCSLISQDVIGGAINTLPVISNRFAQCSLSGDVLLHGTTAFNFSGVDPTVDTSSLTNVYCDGSIFVAFGAFLALEPEGVVYGTYKIQPYARSTLLIEATASGQLLGTPTLRIGFGAGHSTAIAVDASGSTEVRYPGRTLTPANLDAPVGGAGGTGFGGRAEGLDGSAIYVLSAV